MQKPIEAIEVVATPNGIRIVIPGTDGNSATITLTPHTAYDLSIQMQRAMQAHIRLHKDSKP